MPTSELKDCPHCKQKSLFWNKCTLMYECLNRFCKQFITEQELKDGCAREIETVPDLELRNPLLLGVKMFLADIGSWRRQYIEGVYVCDDFTKEVCKAATEKGIRCGYATVYFEARNIAHAIVAFDTDYGLKFIEPQSGEEEIVEIGKPYPVIMDGVPQNAIVSSIEISWNDGSVQSIP